MLDADTEIEKIDIQGENIVLFQDKVNFSKFQKIYGELMQGKLIINELDVNLEFLSNKYTTDLNPRSKIYELFEINLSAFYLLYGGNFPLSTMRDELNEQMMALGYKNVNHACQHLFKRNYGEVSDSPYLTIIASFYVDLNVEIIIPDNILRTMIIHRDADRLDKTKLIIYQKKEDYNLNGPITQVKGISNKSIKLLKDTTSLDIEMYYDDIDYPIEKYHDIKLKMKL